MTVTSQPQDLPKDIKIAFIFWITTLVAGIAESLLRLAQEYQIEADMLTELGVRLLIYAALLVIMIYMKGGRNWARLTLTLILGIIGTLSLIVEPITWLLSGGMLAGLFSTMTPLLALTILSRVVHIIALGGGLGYMYTKAANAYFAKK